MSAVHHKYPKVPSMSVDGIPHAAPSAHSFVACSFAALTVTRPRNREAIMIVLVESLLEMQKVKIRFFERKNGKSLYNAVVQYFSYKRRRWAGIANA